jgi:hypothetical protein
MSGIMAGGRKDGGAFQILSPKQKFWNTFGKKKIEILKSRYLSKNIQLYIVL